MPKAAELYVSRIGKVNWSAGHLEPVRTVIMKIVQLTGRLLQRFANEIGKVKSSAQLDKASFYIQVYRCFVLSSILNEVV